MKINTTTIEMYSAGTKKLTELPRTIHNTLNTNAAERNTKPVIISFRNIQLLFASAENTTLQKHVRHWRTQRMLTGFNPIPPPTET